MNNTMKNLKDEIEGIMNEHSYKQDVRDFGKPATVTQYKAIDLVEAITSLIEQEKERAVMGFIDYMYGQNLPLHKAGVVTVRAFAKQYLAERKE